jgi:hypothetical protein
MLSKLFPENFRSFALKHRDRMLDVVITTQNKKFEQVDEIICKFAKLNDFGVTGEYKLSVIGAFAVAAPCGKLIEIANHDEIDSIWYIHPKIYKVYVNIIKAIGKSINEPNTPLINISLSPPPELLPAPFRPNEPINLATKIASRNNKLILFAAGNGGPNEDSLNPWALAPWVVCVGAASEDGKTLASFSARGRRDDPIYRPTIVAPGLDLEITFTPEDVPTLKEEVKYSANGTSFATPLAAQVAQQIIYFLNNLRRDILSSKDVEDNRELRFAQIYGYKQGNPVDDRILKHRLAGSIDISNGIRCAYYPVNPSPYVVKQIMMDMALEVPGYEAHEVGAGFVSPGLAAHCFDRFGFGWLLAETIPYNVF